MTLNNRARNKIKTRLFPFNLALSLWIIIYIAVYMHNYITEKDFDSYPNKAVKEGTILIVKPESTP